MIDDSWEHKGEKGILTLEQVQDLGRGNRTQKLGKVFVSEETKAILAVIGEKYQIGPSGIAALIIEELRAEGQLNHIWKAHCNRRRKRLYRAKYVA